MAATKPQHLRAHLRTDDPALLTHLEGIAARVGALGVPVELDLTIGDVRADWVREFAGRLARRRPPVVAVHLFSLLSRRRFDSTPELVTAFREVAARVGLTCPIGGGTLANFTELNRAALPTNLLDIATYSINPQVHADDESSIVETLSVLPLTVRQARQLAGAPLSIVMTLKPRFNAAAGAAPVQPGEGLPESVDERQPSPLVAAWTVGAIAALSRRGVVRLTCYETTGMGGVIAGDKALHPHFPALPGDVYPVAGVLGAIGAMQPTSVLATNAPPNTAVLACRRSDGVRIAIANLSGRRRTVQLELPGTPEQEVLALTDLVAADWSKAGGGLDLRLRHGRGRLELDPWGAVLIQKPILRARRREPSRPARTAVGGE